MSEQRHELATVIGLYALGDLSLGQAAHEAGMSQQEFRDVLSDTSVVPRVGPESIEDAEMEVETVNDE